MCIYAYVCYIYVYVYMQLKKVYVVKCYKLLTVSKRART